MQSQRRCPYISCSAQKQGQVNESSSWPPGYQMTQSLRNCECAEPLCDRSDHAAQSKTHPSPRPILTPDVVNESLLCNQKHNQKIAIRRANDDPKVPPSGKEQDPSMPTPDPHAGRGTRELALQVEARYQAAASCSTSE